MSITKKPLNLENIRILRHYANEYVLHPLDSDIEWFNFYVAIRDIFENNKTNSLNGDVFLDVFLDVFRYVDVYSETAKQVVLSLYVDQIFLYLAKYDLERVKQFRE